MSDWLSPDEGAEKFQRLRPNEPLAALLCLDWGDGEAEVRGKAYLVNGENIVFADVGGWCTQYVKKWRPVNRQS